jgi:hypothetical protein
MTCVSDQCTQGRTACPTPDLCAAKKPPFSLWRYACGYVPIILQYRDHKAAKHAGHLAAVTQPKPQPQPQSGIWFAEEEPEIADMAAILFRGLLAMLALATFVGAVAFLIYTIAPLVVVNFR